MVTVVEGMAVSWKRWHGDWGAAPSGGWAGGMSETQGLHRRHGVEGCIQGLWVVPRLSDPVPLASDPLLALLEQDVCEARGPM